MLIDNEMSQIAIERAGSVDAYVNLHRGIRPASGYDYFTIFEKNSFFKWCKELGFDCIGNSVYVDTPGMQDAAIKIAKYEYGPEVWSVVFSYN